LAGEHHDMKFVEDDYFRRQQFSIIVKAYFVKNTSHFTRPRVAAVLFNVRTFLRVRLACVSHTKPLRVCELLPSKIPVSAIGGL
jgi:hypothetical protein